MLHAIQFNDKLAREANEIDHIGADRRLPSKLVSAELLAAQRSPQRALRRRRLIPQLARKLALLIVAVYERYVTPSLTLPARVRGPEELVGAGWVASPPATHHWLGERSVLDGPKTRPTPLSPERYSTHLPSSHSPRREAPLPVQPGASPSPLA